MNRTAVVAPPVPSAVDHDDGRQSGYLPTLDGWRAIAIVGVIICHGTDRILGASGVWPQAQLYALTRYGAYGVDVFFGISGFLITTRLLNEARRRGRIDLRAFYIRRFFRIVPPYLAYLAVATLLAVDPGPGGWTGEVASCLLFVRNYYPGGGWFTGHFWSLSIEEHFYLLWPAFLALVAPRKPTLVVLAVALLIGAWRVIEFRLMLLAAIASGISFFQRTDIRLDSLLMGCVVALVFAGYRTRVTTTVSPGVWLLLVLAFVACVIRQPPLALTWQSILIPLILVGTVAHPGIWFSRFLETSAISWIGRISYSLYLWQQLFLIASDTTPTHFIAWAQRPPVNVVAALVAATASYYVLERPLIALGHRLSRTAPSPSPVRAA